VLLSVSNLRKAYAAPVLEGVSFELRAGEVHALVGENGAGKSTLAKIIAGITTADEGEMRLEEKLFAPAGKAAAEQAGVRIVLQELNLISTLSVAENIFFDRLPQRFGVIDFQRLRREASEVMALIGLRKVDPAQPVGELGVGQQQLVEIAAHLERRTRLLILDEPTAALTPAETELLFAQIEKLKAGGAAVIYISHRLEELQRIADRVSVLRDGRMIASHNAQETSIPQLVREMVGRELSEAVARRPAERSEIALRAERLNAGANVRDVSFDAYRGEILGFAGLVGSGRTETLRAIFGADRLTSGRMYLYGSDVPAKIASPYDAVNLGLALVTEDRKEQGLLPPQSIRANLSIARLTAFSRFGLIDRDAEGRAAREAIRTMNVRCNSAEQEVQHLSGGNQQKVVIAKWLGREPEILLFDEPTRGIDVGAKFEIYRLLSDLAARGKAIIIVSSELEELTALCNRIAVMSAGRLAAIFTRGEWDQDQIMNAAFRGHIGNGTQSIGAER
jgi:ribose transport system ATP-binding protein